MTALTFCTFNNRGFPKARRIDVNRGDYLVRDQVDPDVLMEQERWWIDQLAGFGRIFTKERGYDIFVPGSVGGTLCAHKTATLETIARFSYRAHGAVPYICAWRNYTGAVCRVVGTDWTLTYLSLHFTPSAWSARFPDGSRRKRSAQKAWEKGIRRVLAFVERQVTGGRDFVVIGGDFNAKATKLKEYLPDTIDGKPVRIYTSPATRIDHIIVVGDVRPFKRWAVPGTPSDHQPYAVTLRLEAG